LPRPNASPAKEKRKAPLLATISSALSKKALKGSEQRMQLLSCKQDYAPITLGISNMVTLFSSTNW